MKKKIIITVIGLILIVGLFVVYSIFKKEDSSNITKIKLAEVTHSAFYAPLYVAIEEGYMEEEGIEIELLLTPGADKVAAAVLSGDEMCIRDRTFLILLQDSYYFHLILILLMTY